MTFFVEIGFTSHFRKKKNFFFSGGVNDRALHIAAAKPHPTILSVLLDGGADPALADDEGNTSLHFAAKTGHAGVIDQLLKKAKNPNEVRDLTKILVL